MPTSSLQPKLSFGYYPRTPFPGVPAALRLHKLQQQGTDGLTWSETFFDEACTPSDSLVKGDVSLSITFCRQSLATALISMCVYSKKCIYRHLLCVQIKILHSCTINKEINFIQVFVSAQNSHLILSETIVSRGNI